MKKLSFYSAANIAELAQPSEIMNASIETPALQVFTDFDTVKPLVIESSMSATEVLNIMIKAHVKLIFIIDENQVFLGVVSTEDLAERKILRKVSEGFRRDHIMVSELMRRKEEMLALDYKEVAKASINDVIEALKDSGHQHCLVIDWDTNKVRGIFSASDISRILHLPINIQKKSNFYNVFLALH